MRAVLWGPAILACGALLACGGKGGGSDDPPVIPPDPIPTFRCVDPGQAPAADHVVLRCAAQVAPDEWLIDVVAGVPTSSAEINSLDFDVTIDPLKLAFVPGSAIEGDFLKWDDAETLFAATIEPNDPGSLLVGISRTGGSEIGGISGHDRIMRFRIRALTTAPFEAVVPSFENAEALDSSIPIPQTIPEIVFDDQLLLSVE